MGKIKKKISYNESDFAFIITSIGEKNLTKCLKSIFSQTKKPGQIIVCLPENIDLKYQFKEIQIIKSKFRNQVYQRSIALKLLKKNIKILVQLDSSCELYKNTFNKLILTWSNQSADVAGIGMIPTNYLLPKVNIFQEFFLTNSKNIGKVLKSGYVSAWDRKVKNKNVEWLNGGCVSWRLDLCKDIFKRKYPKIFWSVAEDLIYSFNKSKKFKLMVSNSLKVKYNKVIEPSKLDINNCFKKGFFHSKIIKNFVSYDDQLSLFKYYYATFCSSIFGIFLSISTANLNKLFLYFGRILGALSKTYNYKIK